MNFEMTFDEHHITLTPNVEHPFLRRLLGQQPVKVNLHNPGPDERTLAYALADLRASANELAEFLKIEEERVVLSHRLAAHMSAQAGDILGLPRFVEMTLKTDAEGIVGSPNFRLHYEWLLHGKIQRPRRIGALLKTAHGIRRLPLYIFEAIEIADTHQKNVASQEDNKDSSDWEALARFRKAIDPGIMATNDNQAARASLTDFLSGLQVSLVDSFSISPISEDDFEIVPFDSDKLDKDGEANEGMAVLVGDDLTLFKKMPRERGAMPAYKIPGKNHYVVIEKSSQTALSLMCEKQKAAPEERRYFIQNPRLEIRHAIEEELRRTGQLNGLSPQGEQEAIENASLPLFIETQEFSERVRGITRYVKADIGTAPESGTKWLPEIFNKRMREILAEKSSEELEAIKSELESALVSEKPTINIEGESLPADETTIQLIDHYINVAKKEERSTDILSENISEDDTLPIVLDSLVNYTTLNWTDKLKPRLTNREMNVSENVRTPLKKHQQTSFDWLVKAWKSGLPGVLNADEQGLGKTLQTITFLDWLQKSHEETTSQYGTKHGPILVVAPTSLLRNWEEEVEKHLAADHPLGHLTRLYGAGIGYNKKTGVKGKETVDGIARLNLSNLREAIEENRAHRHWLLTTYTSLTDYQHSLASIPFSAVVFDEIQALKNPASLRAVAARGLNADFRIGLTGTPIENSLLDLWAIMDQLAAGALGSLKEFREIYEEPQQERMAELYERLFKSYQKKPALALRRLKQDVATDLPPKSRRIHPRVMPDIQKSEYDLAKNKLAISKSKGAQLKMLHHIRTVSVHPNFNINADKNFIQASARLQATMDILQNIKASKERVLVFIENRQMQYRFIELAKSELGVQEIDLINGDTPIDKRQEIVNRFQQNFQHYQKFDLLVLGPKAAGTGLTLTAATHVIHLSRWWNPAVEEQCNDRIHRIGQTRPVTIHVPMAVHSNYREHSFDCLLQNLMMRKRRLAQSALWPMGDTSHDVATLQTDMNAAPRCDNTSSDPLSSAIAAMFARDGTMIPVKENDGSYLYE